jgi:hypothetical protein
LLEDADVGEIFSDGLHEFLTAAVARNIRLSNQIAEAYHF